MTKYRGLIGAATRPMNQSESTMMIQATMLGMNASEKLPEIHADLMGVDGNPKSFEYAVMFKRLEAIRMADYVSTDLCIFIASICKGPGDAVLWAYTLGQMIIEGEVKKVGITEWVEYFPMGIPTDEGKEAAWDGQKGMNIGLSGVDNWLDDLNNWPCL